MKYLLALFLLVFAIGCAKNGSNLTLEKQSLAQKYKLEILQSNCENLGDIASCGKAGESAENLGLIDKALKFYQFACEKGDSSYCIKLGKLYEKGAQNLAKNPSKAIKIYDKVCKKNNPLGCKAAGDFFFNRFAYESALEYFNKACTNGEMNSCFEMAKMFENGIGVVKDKKLAYGIYTTICFRGDEEGCAKMKELEIYK